MDNGTVTPEREVFSEDVRDALTHLYDPDRLSRSALAGAFGVANRYDTPAALRRILTEAIEALEPGRGEPAQSRAWRLYYVLVYLYVEGMSQQEAAQQMAISDRQLRREQRLALDRLADRLWERFGLDETASASPAAAGERPSGAQAMLEDELAWLRNGASQTPTDLDKDLAAAMELAMRLAAEHGTRLRVHTGVPFPRLAVQPVAFRQILLSLLSVAIPRAAGGELRVTTAARGWEVEFRIECDSYPSGPKPSLPDEAAGLDMARRLAEISGGSLELAVDARAFDALLVLPAFEQLPVLAIDDNADTLRLMQRFVAGTRYRLITTSDPDRAPILVEEASPQIIVLDVMMPVVDGWEVLARLRQHPLTSETPIIVCTILAQKELALLLGASGFVRKPVTRQLLLAALDDQIRQRVPIPR